LGKSVDFDTPFCNASAFGLSTFDVAGTFVLGAVGRVVRVGASALVGGTVHRVPFIKEEARNLR
jgi:hypothetical protein